MEIPRHWRLKKQRYSLVGEVCENGHKVFPPRDVCPDCHGEAKIPFKFNGKGEIYSFTTIYEAPEGYQAPYTVAIVKLDEGPMLTAQITDVKPTEVHIGLPVEVVTRKLRVDGDNDRGIIIYGYKFRPVSLPMEASNFSK